ncbi:glial cell line-derived neurotrophic factor [Hippocampus zosterae]|uniref:glial cell line-derived neurotrophic factor n=1 Tax=Hippocampus zosterae TaxID=109293 RepID=UPI00223E6A74|nr:glial cell line-derived neurotrophic factor [Hippocampus zosterae]
MNLWDVAAMCLLLLSSVATRPLYQNIHPAKRTLFPASYSDSAHQSAEDQGANLSMRSAESNLQEISMEDQYDASPYSEQFADVMDFIEATIGRLRRSSDSRGPKEREQRHRGAAKNTRGGGKAHGGDRKRGRSRGGGTRGAGGGKAGRGERGRGRTSARAGRGCLLKEVHLNVTDLGLGYQTKEELIFRYCSGPCAEAETNYDKILSNLSHGNKLDRDAPSRTCCRPVAFDDDLSFLDDNVVYHTLKKHSAKRCACV